MACDLCGKQRCGLVALRDIYQTAVVKEVCYECEGDLNKRHAKLLDWALEMVRRFMRRYICEKAKEPK